MSTGDSPQYHTTTVLEHLICGTDRYPQPNAMATKPRYTVLSAMLRLTDITPPAIPVQSAKRGFRKPPDSTHLLFFCLVFEEHRISISQFWQPQYASESLFFMSSSLYVMRCGPNRVIYIHPSATTSHLLAVRVEVERAQPKPQYCQRLPLRLNRH